MSKLKRLLASGALTAMLVSLALAGPAQAEKVVGACLINGEAKMADKADPSVGVRITGGKGDFTFSALLITCVGMSKGTPDAQILGAEARGVFVNVICGTGKAWGTITSLIGPAKYRNLILGKKFAIHFLGSWPAATTGVFFWHKTKAAKGPDLKDDVLDDLTKILDDGWAIKPKDDKGWHPAGAFRLDYSEGHKPTSILPPIPDPARNHCTKVTTVTGTVTINEA